MVIYRQVVVRGRQRWHPRWQEEWQAVLLRDSRLQNRCRQVQNESPPRG